MFKIDDHLIPCIMQNMMINDKNHTWWMECFRMFWSLRFEYLWKKYLTSLLFVVKIHCSTSFWACHLHKLVPLKLALLRELTCFQSSISYRLCCKYNSKTYLRGCGWYRFLYPCAVYCLQCSINLFPQKDTKPWKSGITYNNIKALVRILGEFTY